MSVLYLYQFEVHIKKLINAKQLILIYTLKMEITINRKK